MGKYVNEDSKGNALGTSFESKVNGLLNDGAEKDTGFTYKPNLICVVDNGFFAAAGYAYCEAEWNEFRREDGRHKVWLTHPMAEQLAK